MPNRMANTATAKIAFHLMGSDTWQFGTVYLSDLFRALRETFAKSVAICILLFDSERSVPYELGKLVDEIIVYPRYGRWTALWVIDRGAKLLLRRDLMGDLFLKRQEVRVVAFGEAPQRSNIPTLAWLPDFQHIRLPEMFSIEERQARDRWFLRIAEQATRVILLSESVRRDFEAFAAKHAYKARVVSPVSYVLPSVYESDPKSVSDLYHLPDKFVYLPNQFWKHKNHGTALHALSILKGKGIEVFLVCSGYPGDYRHPHYFADLFRKASYWDIRNQVSFLGLLPRDQVFMLMRQSICVLNPSLFEGYGMAVEEARSLGKQVILSDIPAHREQNPPKGIFFDPRDREDLARKLEQIWREKLPGPDKEMEIEARHNLPERIRRYAEAFMSVVQEVTAG